MSRCLLSLAVLSGAAGSVGPQPCAVDPGEACATVPTRHVASAGWALLQHTSEVQHGTLVRATEDESVSQSLDFTVVIIPDTQFMVMDNGYSGAWLHEWVSQADWVVEKRRELNIAAVIHVGDVVEEAHRSWEWNNFFSGWDKIEATGVPWSVVPGNHDLTSMAQPFAPNRWDDYNRYMEPAFRRNPHLQSSFPPGEYENSVVFFEAAGAKFMVVGIELGPTQESLLWASDQLNRYPDRRAIINNHFVLWGAERGIDIAGWAKRHRNIFMIHQGHDCAREWNRVLRNDWGEPIQEVLADYQCSGDAFLRYYTFRITERRVDAFTYSPSLGIFETDANSQWSFDFDLNAPPSLPSAEPAPAPHSPPLAQPTAAPAPSPGNHYRAVSGVGGWGGWCTCPDGQRYNVGDNDDACANGPQSLACDGGTPGECVHRYDEARRGMKVTCAPAPSNPVPSVGNFYREVTGVGGWGGWCTCPDGQRYNVGDNDDACASGPQSLACEGGTPGECVHRYEDARRGMKVTCAPPAENFYRKAAGVGGWGGWCTCPDGQRYNVGDNDDACASGPQSLACEGGAPGECVHKHDRAREGMKVTCAAGR